MSLTTVRVPLDSNDNFHITQLRYERKLSVSEIKGKIRKIAIMILVSMVYYITYFYFHTETIFGDFIFTRLSQVQGDLAPSNEFKGVHVRSQEPVTQWLSVVALLHICICIFILFLPFRNFILADYTVWTLVIVEGYSDLCCSFLCHLISCW